MNILTLIALLAGSNWSTTCVMTQANGLQGYTIDSAVFTKGTADATSTLNVSLTRVWYKDQNCTDVNGEKSAQSGTVTIGNPIDTMTFPGSVPEDILAADWNLGEQVTQLGAIAVAKDGKSIRTVTNSFGSSRNTMLSLFRYFAK